MPGPIIKKKELDVANLASKLPEPLRKSGGFIGQLIKDAVLDDPLAGITPPLISIYKDAAGIPSKTLRQGATGEFLESAKRLGVRGITAASESFASRYPRVAAHMRINPIVKNDNNLATATLPFGPITEPVPVNFGRRGMELIISNPGVAKGLLGHEATHVAQGLGNKDLSLLYKLADKAVGYKRNPFELSAGARELAEMYNHKVSPTPALRSLRTIAETKVPGTTAPQNIKEILEARTNNLSPSKELLSIFDEVSPRQPAELAAKESQNNPLLRTLVEHYKQSIQRDKSIIGHPGLRNIPEFRKAFRELYPRERIPLEPRPPALTADGKKALSGRWNTKSPAARSANSTLTEEGVRKVKAQVASGKSVKEIATELNMSPASIDNIVKGHTWYWVK